MQLHDDLEYWTKEIRTLLLLQVKEGSSRIREVSSNKFAKYGINVKIFPSTLLRVIFLQVCNNIGVRTGTQREQKQS